MSSAKYRSKDYKTRVQRTPGKKETVFDGRDQVTNTLNGNFTEEQAVKETLEGGGLDPEKAQPAMEENSPYGDKAYMVKHEAIKTKNFSESEAQKHLDDPKGEYDIEFDEDGEIYNLRLLEAIQHKEGHKNDRKDDIIGKDSNNTEALENDLMGIHAIVYEDPSGEDYLLHWDPGRFTPEGDKRKYLPEGDKPSLEHRSKDADVEFYEDNKTYKLDKGLKVVRDTLKDMKNRLYSEASETADAEGYTEEVADKAWEAERWRGITESVETLRKSRNYQKPVNREINTLEQ